MATGLPDPAFPRVDVDRRNPWGYVRFGPAAREYRKRETIKMGDNQHAKFGLSLRETFVLSEMVAGYSDKEIAEHHDCGEGAVAQDVNNILKKMNLATRERLINFAVEHGFTSPTLNRLAKEKMN